MNLPRLYKNFLTLGLAPLVAASSLMAFAPSVSAAGAIVGTTVSPPIMEITASAGDTVRKTWQVHNTSDISQSYTYPVQSFVPSGEEGGQAFLPPVSGDLASWITVVPSASVLAADQTANVQIVIKVPAGATPGGHYATVFASTQTGGAAGNAIGVNQMIGLNILVNVPGNVKESADVVEFSTSRSRLFMGEPVNFTVRVKNTGNTHVKPQGVINIYMADRLVDQLLVNADGGNVLPNSIRKFVATSNKGLAAGTYTAKLALKYGGQTIEVPGIQFSVVSESSLMAVGAGLFALFVVIVVAAFMMKRKKV